MVTNTELLDFEIPPCKYVFEYCRFRMLWRLDWLESGSLGLSFIGRIGES